MNKLKNLIIATVFAMSLTTSASSFEGLSVGLTAVDGDFDTTGKETTANRSGTGGALEVVKGSVTESAEFGSGFVEWTFAQGSTIGMEIIPGSASVGSKSRTHAQTDATEAASGTATAKGEISDHIMLYVEPTVMFTDNLGAYVKGGAARITVNSLEQMGTLGSSVYGNVDVWGVAYGVGAKAYMGSFFTKVEHLVTEYGTVSLTSTAGNKNKVEADIEQKATKISIGYNF